MAKELSQDEINNLLSPVLDNKEDKNRKKRRGLYQEFLKNNKSFNTKIIKELIDSEMKNRQEEGYEINVKYMKKEISQDYAKKKVKECGSGVWWGGESEWYITGVKNFIVNKTKRGSFHISTVCTMEYISSHFVYGEKEPMQQDAKITLTLSETFDMEEFIFSWR